jgi:hypothetical protein
MNDHVAERDRPRTLTQVRHRSHPSRTAPRTISLSPSLSQSFSLARIIDRHHSHHRLRHCLTLAIDLAISTSLSPTLLPSLAIALIIRHRSRHRSHQCALSLSPSLALLLIIPSCTTSNPHVRALAQDFPLTPFTPSVLRAARGGGGCGQAPCGVERRLLAAMIVLRPLRGATTSRCATPSNSSNSSLHLITVIVALSDRPMIASSSHLCRILLLFRRRTRIN